MCKLELISFPVKRDLTITTSRCFDAFKLAGKKLSTEVKTQ